MPPMDDQHRERRKQLEARLDAIEAEKAKEASVDSHRAMAQGYRFLGEVVGGVFMGAALGFAVDYFAGTKPLGLVIGLFGGAGLSIFVAVKTAARNTKKAVAEAGPLPSVPDDEDED
jgi:ATP synthase protein I